MNDKKLHVVKTILGIFGCLIGAIAIWLLVDFSMLTH